MQSQHIFSSCAAKKNIDHTAYDCYLVFVYVSFQTQIKLFPRAMAATFAMYFGIAMGVFSGFGLLIGCLATGRTRYNVCGMWKTRFVGRCCVIMVSNRCTIAD